MIFIGISGCFSVLFGAWLAHGGQVLPLTSQERLATALQYQFIHTLALFLSVTLYIIQPRKVLLLSAFLFVLGILMFSGSLYIKTFIDIQLIGKLAPLGGLSFAFAWLCIGFAGKHLLGNKLK
jgi:uncharacterized membrane protein YgdD (TMEM256/DUF423 family)